MRTSYQPRATRLLRAVCLLSLTAPVCHAGSDSSLWLEESLLNPQQRQEVTTLWGGRPLRFQQLDRLMQVLAQADVRIAESLAAAAVAESPADPAASTLSDLPAAIRADLALRTAAEHCFHRRYLAALEWLDASSPELCASPQLYWYYRAVVCHQLVQMEEAAEAAEQLLASSDVVERRLTGIAELILRDAKADKPGSLDHVAHQMGDVRRRLLLGQADEPNQVLQQEVIDALDKLIEQAEQQRQQQQQQQASQMAQGESSRPMEESRIAELKGAGEVDEREITPGGDWGSLPPAERERVTQQIIRDFPAHYRDVIEDYFRSLATEPDASTEGGQR